MAILRALLPRAFEFVLYRVDRLPPPDAPGLDIELATPERNLNPDQRRFLQRHLSRLGMWWLLRWRRRGWGWVAFARAEGRYCHYMFVTPARRYRKIFPVIQGAKALLLGPALTERAFRGRGILTQVLRHVVNQLAQQGYGPFYADTSTSNAASIRGVEKTGLRRCGVWAGKRALGQLWVRSTRVSE